MNAAFRAARDGNWKALKRLLKSVDRKKLFSYVDWDGDSILPQAIISKNAKCVRIIVDAFPALTKHVNNEKMTPLHVACKIKADLKIIKILCEVKRTINMKNRYGQTALFEALDTNDNENEISDGYLLELIKILIENGASIHEKTQNGCTILHEAVNHNKFEEFKLLFNYGVKIDSTNAKGHTVLHLATMSDKCDFVKFIVEKDPKLVNILDDDCNSPLFHACESGCESCVEFLLKNKADVLQLDRAGHSCIEVAVKNGQSKSVAKLLEYGADPLVYTGGSSCSQSALHYACLRNYVEIVELLLNHESINTINKYVIDEKMVHPLIYVVQENPNAKILKLILNHPLFFDETLTINLPGKNDVHGGLIGYLLYSLLSTNTSSYVDEKSSNILECSNLLAQQGYRDIPSKNKNALSAITCVLLAENMNFDMLGVVKSLIYNGSSVTDVWMSDEICREYEINIELRHDLRIPDALTIAFASGNSLVTMYLLRYWPQPPILLILIFPTISGNLKQWFDILIEFGWPTGHEFAEQLRQFMERKGLGDDIAPLVQNPSSLKCLAKFATRKYLFEKRSEFKMRLPKLIKSLDIPLTLTDELLFVGHKYVLEDAYDKDYSDDNYSIEHYSCSDSDDIDEDSSDNEGMTESNEEQSDEESVGDVDEGPPQKVPKYM